VKAAATSWRRWLRRRAVGVIPSLRFIVFVFFSVVESLHGPPACKVRLDVGNPRLQGGHPRGPDLGQEHAGFFTGDGVLREKVHYYGYTYPKMTNNQTDQHIQHRNPPICPS
jgi:hypothetical protein